MSEPKPTIVFLSTYPPRECGIATFTQDLLQYSQKFLGPLVSCKVAALNLSPLDTYKYPPEVEWKIDQNSEADLLNLAKTINDDIHITGVIIQHEYGIFGGKNGRILLFFMQKCKKPILVTLHTILPNPDPYIKSVTASIIQLASTVVVLTNTSKQIIENLYPDSIGKVFVIPHGIHSIAESKSKDYKTKLKLNNHTILTTFGLLSRGKGIEYVLQALPDVVKKYPSVLYLILGETHPVIRRSEGEKYRVELAELVVKLGLQDHVKFYDQYFCLPDLFEFLKATDIYIATSTDPNQSVSGTLSYALGAGRAVISTEFAQAKEIVTPNVGCLVPIKDSSFLKKAIIDLLGNEKKLTEMNRHAYKKTRPMLWDTVVEEYIMLLERLVVPILNLDHLRAMTDEFGLFQFASLSKPNKDSGYTLDDNARALIASSWLLKKEPEKELKLLLNRYLSFIKKCQLKDGSFINYIEYRNKTSTLQNNAEDIEDAQMRALWALAEIMANPALTRFTHDKAKKMFLLKLDHGIRLTHLRSKAFAIKAFTLALDILPEKKIQLLEYIKTYADSLITALTKHSFKSWRWFEINLNYNNAILPESLLIAGNVLQNKNYTKQAILSLDFLISKTFSKTYMPIGHAQWYKNKEKRSNYDQQPEDPASMILALSSSYYYTHDIRYKKLANICFSWFLGNNSIKKSLYDYTNGGCYDGLHPDRVNKNQGAESLVSYLMARYTITQLN